MSFWQVFIIAAHLFFALVGVGLVLLGAWGSLRFGRRGPDTPLTTQQRIMVTVMGLFVLAAVWHNMSGRLPPSP